MNNFDAATKRIVFTTVKEYDTEIIHYSLCGEEQESVGVCTHPENILSMFESGGFVFEKKKSTRQEIFRNWSRFHNKGGKGSPVERT